MKRKALLICGILSSLLYTAMTIFVPMRYEGYSSFSQTVSELSAIDAPTRQLWVVLGIAYTLLVIAFGKGISETTQSNRPLRILGGLVVAYGVVSLAWPFVPMHLRGAEFTLTDTIHIVLAMVTVVLMLLAAGFGAAAFGWRFRLYSIGTVVTLVAFGALTGLDAPRIAANLPTPWIGVWERINIGGFMLWVAVLATMLLRIGEIADSDGCSWSSASRSAQADFKGTGPPTYGGIPMASLTFKRVQEAQ